MEKEEQEKQEITGMDRLRPRLTDVEWTELGCNSRLKHFTYSLVGLAGLSPQQLRVR